MRECERSLEARPISRKANKDYGKALHYDAKTAELRAKNARRDTEFDRGGSTKTEAWSGELHGLSTAAKQRKIRTAAAARETASSADWEAAEIVS